MYKRFHWDETIRFTNSLWNEVPKIKKPSRIFVGSTMELFGSWIDPEWMRITLECVKKYSQHTFIFLTKKPENLKKWEFPNNAWVGVSATDYTTSTHAIDGLNKVKATVKFISFEPIKSVCTNQPIRFAKSLQLVGIKWLILGQQTPVRKSTEPHIDWVRNIVESADIAKIPVLIKNNLESLLKKHEGWTEGLFVSARKCDGKEYLRQEFPKEGL
jgi:protein gp37